MPNQEPEKLQPILEHMLQSRHEGQAEHNRLLEQGIEMTAQGNAKIADKIGEVVKALGEKKDDGVRKVEILGAELVTIKGEKGEPGNDADEQKIIDAVSEKLPKKEDIIAEVTPVILEKVPKIEDIVAQVVPKIEPGAPGKPGDDGEDADPDEVATRLKNDPIFIEKTKGEPGAPGNDGDDGSPETGEQIVQKIKGFFSYNDLTDKPDIFGRQSSGGGFLKDMADVSVLTEPTNGQGLIWNSTLKKWTAGTVSSGGGTPALPFNSIQFNNAGAFGGSAKFTFDTATNVFYLYNGSGSEFVKFDPPNGIFEAVAATHVYLGLTSSPRMMHFIDSGEGDTIEINDDNHVDAFALNIGGDARASAAGIGMRTKRLFVERNPSGGLTNPDIMTDYLSGRVGMETDTPNAKLHVVGIDFVAGTGTLEDDGNGNITGTGTSFTTQLSVGDLIYVDNNGYSQQVVSIASNTSMVVTPAGGAFGDTFTYKKSILRVTATDGTNGITVFPEGNVKTAPLHVYSTAYIPGLGGGSITAAVENPGGVARFAFYGAGASVLQWVETTSPANSGKYQIYVNSLGQMSWGMLNDAESVETQFMLFTRSGTTPTNIQFKNGFKVGVGTTPTAFLHLLAGTATANTAPLKFSSGTLLTTAEAGAVEFLTDKYYGTITTGAARKEITLNDVALTSGRVPFVTTNGRLTDDADMTFATDTLTVAKIVASTSVNITGSLQTDSIVNDTGLAAGTYTPTRSAEANMDANVTMTEAQYMRVGNTVTVSGRFTADPTLAATTTSFEITLPVASNIGAAEDVAGVAFCGNIAAQGAEVIGVAANDTAKVQWKSADVTSQVWSYTFTYQVI